MTKVKPIMENGRYPMLPPFYDKDTKWSAMHGREPDAGTDLVP